MPHLSLHLIALPILLHSLLLPPTQANAQVLADPDLLADINRIKAIDNHAHPHRVVNAAETDDEIGPARATTEPPDIPVRLRPDNPEYLLAARTLYGLGENASAEETAAARQRIVKERGDAFPAWVLDQLGIDVMFANRVAMGRGLVAPRFRWVPFADALMYPLDNSGPGAANPDYRLEYEGTGRLLKRYLKEAGLSELPRTLDGYLGKVVDPTLTRQKSTGAVALKFLTAYLRPLDFGNPPEKQAREVYARFVKGGAPSAGDYKALQDFLFRYIARKAGELALPVHIHVGSGASGYFNQTGGSPFLLEPVLNDPALRDTKFVLVHGGSPFGQETRMLIYKPNVYADFSAQTFLLSTRELSTVLRSWLEFVPEKVLFGTDAFAITPEVGWPEHAWLTTRSAREALALALTGMMKDGQITCARALELARMVMRENAAKLYGLAER
jgi:predicted TIM-barrel fold metal-dependent hydrolase